MANSGWNFESFRSGALVEGYQYVPTSSPVSQLERKRLAAVLTSTLDDLQVGGGVRSQWPAQNVSSGPYKDPTNWQFAGSPVGGQFLSVLRPHKLREFDDPRKANLHIDKSVSDPSCWFTTLLLLVQVAYWPLINHHEAFTKNKWTISSLVIGHFAFCLFRWCSYCHLWFTSPSSASIVNPARQLSEPPVLRLGSPVPGCISPARHPHVTSAVLRRDT